MFLGGVSLLFLSPAVLANSGTVAGLSQRLHRMEFTLPVLENVHHFVAQQGADRLWIRLWRGFSQNDVSRSPWCCDVSRIEFGRLLLFPLHSNTKTLGLIEESLHALLGG